MTLHVSRSFFHSSPLVHLADIETWYCHLGHLNPDTIIAMVHSKAVQGMPIDISFAPPKCDSCILGKQTCLSVPKIWEGVQASRPLNIVLKSVWANVSSFTLWSSLFYKCHQ